MKHRTFSAKDLATAGLVAALYVLLTFFANMLGLASGVIQVRFSEALTILPLFTPAAVPGLFAGCLLANLLTGSAPWDVLFGSLATLLGALGTLWAGRHLPPRVAPIAGVLSPILCNCLIVPLILKFVYGFSDAYPFLLLTVGIGEAISCGLLGGLLYRVLRKRRIL